MNLILFYLIRKKQYYSNLLLFAITVKIFQTQHSTPHSVHSLPHSSDIMRDQTDLYYSLVDHERERMLDPMRQIDNRYEYRDREREEFERECDREQKLENERYANER